MLQMKYFGPDPRLNGLITSYYLMTTVNGAHVEIDDYLLPEWSNLRCQVQGSVNVHGLDGCPGAYLACPPPQNMLFGSTVEARRIELSGVVRIIGAGIFPRGWHEFFGVPAGGWTHKIGGVCDIWGHNPTETWRNLALASSEDEIKSILDKLFLDRIASAPQPPRSIVTEAVEQLLVNPNMFSVEEVADRVGISVRQLERISRDIFGHTPKQVIRKFRFLRCIAALPDAFVGGWEEAIDQHYYDQSHFIRDFKQFTGVTPTQFLKAPPILMYGYMRSIGKAISLQTIPSAFYIYDDASMAVQAKLAQTEKAA